MERKGHGVTWEQWDKCRRCGKYYPMNRLKIQRGLLKCLDYCHDNLDNVTRERQIQDALGLNMEEFVDHRVEDHAWFGAEWDLEGG